MAVRREITESAFLVKRISHASTRTHSFRPALHASRTASDEERSSGLAIAAEALMNHVGERSDLHWIVPRRVVVRRGLSFTQGSHLSSGSPLNLERTGRRVARLFIEERVDRIVPSKAFDLDLEPEIVGAVGIDQGLLE
jgi:hypothetical protein